MCLHHQSNALDQDRVGRLQAAHILICLANDQSADSSQSEGDQISYSAGWGLYRAARQLYGDLLDNIKQIDDQIVLLRIVLLMYDLYTCGIVSYTFRPSVQ